MICVKQCKNPEWSVNQTSTFSKVENPSLVAASEAQPSLEPTRLSSNGRPQHAMPAMGVRLRPNLAVNRTRRFVPSTWLASIRRAGYLVGYASRRPTHFGEIMFDHVKF